MQGYTLIWLVIAPSLLLNIFYNQCCCFFIKFLWQTRILGLLTTIPSFNFAFLLSTIRDEKASLATKNGMSHRFEQGGIRGSLMESFWDGFSSRMKAGQYVKRTFLPLGAVTWGGHVESGSSHLNIPGQSPGECQTTVLHTVMQSWWTNLGGATSRLLVELKCMALNFRSSYSFFFLLPESILTDVVYKSLSSLSSLGHRLLVEYLPQLIY